MPPVVTFVVLGLLVLVVVFILVRCIRIVQQSKAYIIERLGRLPRDLERGSPLQNTFY